MSDLTPEPIMNIASNTWVRKPLVVAVELDVFGRINKGENTAQKIAENLNTKTDSIERLLNACVALNFLEKDNDVYKNTKLAEKFLIKESPAYYGDMVLMTDKLAKDWDNLKESILNTGKLGESNTNFEDPVFTRAMHNNALAPASVLAEKVDLSNYKNLLDLGGGSGAFSIVLTNKYKELKATVFELPKVCETANEYIEKLGDSSRVKTFKGDYFKDKLPEGFDVALISHILHSHNVEQCKSLIKKTYGILPENGLIMINEFVLNPDKTSPVFSVLFSLNMLLANAGATYTEEEIRSWLVEVGFKDIEVVPLVGPHTAIIGKK